MDKAFERRITFKVDFVVPTQAERALLWRRLLPPDAPVASDVDIEGLAESFELAGGAIKNAVLRAAYQAAARGSATGQAGLVTAARAEAKASGMLVRERHG